MSQPRVTILNPKAFIIFFVVYRTNQMVPTYKQLKQKVRELESKIAKLEHANLKQNNNKVNQLEARFNKVFHSNPAAMLISTVEEGRIIDFNDSFMNLSGYGDEIIGKTSIELIFFDNENERKEIISRLRETGSIKNYVKNIKLKSGELRTALVFIECIEIDQEECLLSVFVDITSIKKIETELRLEKKQLNEKNYDCLMLHKEFIEVINELDEKNKELEALNERLFEQDAQLKNLVETAPVPVFVIVDDKIEFLNKSAVELHGASEKFEITGQLMSEIVHPEYIDLVQVKIENLYNCKSYSEFFECKHIRVDNQVIDLEGVLVPIRIKKRKGTIAFVRDITERNKYEEELRAAKRNAEKSDQLKTAFIHNLSHEIRTPLNAILGFSHMMKKHDLNAEMRQTYADIIINSGNHLLSVVNDILTISTLDTEQETVVTEKIYLNALFKSIIDEFHTKITGKGLALVYNPTLLTDDTCIYTDSKKIARIFTYLVSNALKFTDEGYIEFGYHKTEFFLEFYVKDTGIGIDTDDQKTIFEKFGAKSSPYAGIGLGLAISKGFVELLGGEIRVTSLKGKGSTFYFTIPYHFVE